MWSEGSEETESSSITAASDCIKRPSYTAEELPRDVAIYPLLLLAFPYTHRGIHECVCFFCFAQVCGELPF